MDAHGTAAEPQRQSLEPVHLAAAAASSSPSCLLVSLKRGDGFELGTATVQLPCTVRALADALHAMHAQPLRALVFRGKVLGLDRDARETFDGVAAPVVYVVFEPHSVRAPPASQPLRATRSGDAPARTCRICMGEDETEERLFRPCDCRGTAGLVHLGCLNAWRATNPHAMRACAVCGFEYRLSRARFAGVLASHEFAQYASLACLVLLVLAVGTADALLDAAWWDWAEMERPASAPVRAAVVGVALVGGIGFASHLAQVLDVALRHGGASALVSLAAMTAVNGKRGLRLLALAGLATVFPLLRETVEAWVRRSTVRWGERVLAVDA